MNDGKIALTGITGAVGGVIAAALGGRDNGLRVLVWFMVLDYLTGLAVAGVFKKSPKSPNGALESRAGWKGLWRKGGTLVVVFVSVQLDSVMGTDFLRDSVIIAYIVNETISLVENAGLMGIPIPLPLRKAIDILTKKGEDDKHENLS